MVFDAIIFIAIKNCEASPTKQDLVTSLFKICNEPSYHFHKGVLPPDPNRLRSAAGLHKAMLNTENRGDTTVGKPNVAGIQIPEPAL